MSNLSVSDWDSGMPQRDGGLSSRGQAAGSYKEMRTHCVQCHKRGHAGPEGAEKRGAKVRVQEDQAGKDTLNITPSLRAGPVRQGKNR